MATQPLQFSTTSALDAAGALVGSELVRMIQDGDDVKSTVSFLLAAALTLPKLTGLATSDASAVVSTDSVIEAIGKLQAAIGSALKQSDVGTGATQVPLNQLLGRVAFGDVVGATKAYMHNYESSIGDVWFEHTDNNTLTLKYHGQDNVVRSSTIALT